MSDAPAAGEPSLQERYAPHNACFGCGPANERGLRIRSFPAADEEGLVCTWTPEPHHEAFDGVLNGGIIGTILDCHSNWTALWHLMRRDGLDRAPCTVTADFHVRMKHPTPTTGPVELRSRVVESAGKRVKVLAELSAGGRVTATCEGNFVAVGPGHPAHHRW
jgi:acyl-coenzyme A thioesterase PaaI-like protein